MPPRTRARGAPRSAWSSASRPSTPHLSPACAPKWILEVERRSRSTANPVALRRAFARRGGHLTTRPRLCRGRCRGRCRFATSPRRRCLRGHALAGFRVRRGRPLARPSGFLRSSGEAARPRIPWLYAARSRGVQGHPTTRLRLCRARCRLASQHRRGFTPRPCHARGLRVPRLRTRTRGPHVARRLPSARCCVYRGPALFGLRCHQQVFPSVESALQSNSHRKKHPHERSRPSPSNR
jgi:hypothetical protein